MKRDAVKIQAHFLFGFLILQFLFGMFVNLFVQFPNTTNEKILWEFARGQTSLVIHMIIALLLVIGGIVFLIRTVIRKDRKLIIAAVIGLLTILISTYTGVEFVSSQQDGYSFTMAVAFIFSLISYGWVILHVKK
jgi:hypothetical protein